MIKKITPKNIESLAFLSFLSLLFCITDAFSQKTAHLKLLKDFVSSRQ